MGKKDKFIVTYAGSKYKQKWSCMEKALRHYNDQPSWPSCCEFWINDQLVMKSYWDTDRYKRDGWYGYITVVSRGIPLHHYKRLVTYLKRWTSAVKAEEFHRSNYHGLGCNVCGETEARRVRDV